MALRITNIETDLPKLNTELARMDLHQQQITELQNQVGQLTKQLLTNSTTSPANHLSQNNLTFVWTGSVTTLSWAAGYIHSNGVYIHVASGSIKLTPSTYYWMAWNPTHQTMSAQTDYSKLFNLIAAPDTNTISIVCQIFTGAGGQSGSVGGGGTEPGGIGNNGKQYKLF